MGDEGFLLLADGVVEDLAEQAGDVMGVEPGGAGLGDEAGEQVFLAAEVAQAAVAR